MKAGDRLYQSFRKNFLSHKYISRRTKLVYKTIKLPVLANGSENWVRTGNADELEKE